MQDASHIRHRGNDSPLFAAQGELKNFGDKYNVFRTMPLRDCNSLYIKQLGCMLHPYGG